MEPIRCFSDVDPIYHAYHDEEWGRPLHGDNALFEQITLEGFQSGLSWLTILKKRAAFRQAFDNFSPAKIARYTDADVARLMNDAGIIRNKRKIEAAITNARATVALQQTGKTLDALIWSHQPSKTPEAPRSWADVPAYTQESTALAKALKQHGFVFVGPTTMYAMMQSIGMVNDHLNYCLTRQQ